MSTSVQSSWCHEIPAGVWRSITQYLRLTETCQLLFLHSRFSQKDNIIQSRFNTHVGEIYCDSINQGFKIWSLTKKIRKKNGLLANVTGIRLNAGRQLLPYAESGSMLSVDPPRVLKIQQSIKIIGASQRRRCTKETLKMKMKIKKNLYCCGKGVDGVNERTPLVEDDDDDDVDKVTHLVEEEDEDDVKGTHLVEEEENDDDVNDKVTHLVGGLVVDPGVCLELHGIKLENPWGAGISLDVSKKRIKTADYLLRSYYLIFPF